MQAAELFTQGVSVEDIAARLRVSTKSVYQWRRRWTAGGEQALASAGQGGPGSKLTEAQFARLREHLDAGAGAYGWADQRWTLARVADLIEGLFDVSYTLKGVSLLLHRMGYSLQVPDRRAVERDEEAVGTWRRGRWPSVRD